MNKQTNNSKKRKANRSAPQQNVTNISTKSAPLKPALQPSPDIVEKENTPEPTVKKSRRSEGVLKRLLKTPAALVRSHWKGVVTAIFTIVVAVTGWQVSTCISERRSRLQDFKTALSASQPVSQKMLEAEQTLQIAHMSFVDYLSQDNVQLEEIKKREDQLITAAKTHNESCNAWRDATIRYFGARREVLRAFRRSYDMPSFKYTGACGESVRLASGGWPEDLSRLVTDINLRRSVVARERFGIARIRDLYIFIIRHEPAIFEAEYKLIKEFDSEDSSLLDSTCACLGISNTK